ncbi:MAG TPA: hypothetical protein VLD62_11960 [Acidimicrobiia bacterium]|nr:hypothetical protein [Acidimicrobiia bacterium]
MRDHQAFRNAFSVMLADTPVAPTWEALEHHVGATTTVPEPPRRRPLAVVLAAAAAALVLVGGAMAIYLALGGGNEQVADTSSTTSPTVPVTTTLPLTTTTAVTGETTLPTVPPSVPTTGVIPGDPAPTVPQSLVDPRLTIVDAEGVVGAMAAMALMPNGNPVIAYADYSNGQVKLAECVDPTCSDPATISVIADKTPPMLLKLTVTSGVPVVAMPDAEDHLEGDPPIRIRVVTPTSDRFVTELSAGVSGQLAGLGSTVDGRTLVAGSFFIPYDGPRMTFIECGDVTCETIVRTNTIELAGDVEVTYTPDGRPVWFMDKEIHLCSDAVCADGVSSLPFDTDLDYIANGDIDVTFTESGFPVVAWAEFDADADAADSPSPVHIAVCADAECSSFATAIIPAFTSQLDVTVRASGEPVVVWSDGQWEGRAAAGQELHVARCLDAACSEWISSPTGLPAGDADVLATDDGGLLIAYETGSDLAILTCADGTCADSPQLPAPVAVDVAQWARSTVLTGAQDRFPRLGPTADGSIAILDRGLDERLIAVVCDSLPCDAAAVTELPATEAGWWFAVAAGTTGEPGVLAVTDGVQWIRCADAECSDITITELEAETRTWTGTDVVISEAGLAYGLHTDYSEPGAPVKLVGCADAACTELIAGTPTTIDSTFGAWHTPQLAIGSDGFPVIALWRWDALQVVDCEDAACTERAVQTISIDGGGGGGVRIAADDGRLAIAFITGDSRLALALCEEPGCSDLRVSYLDRSVQTTVLAVGFSDGSPIVSYLARNEARLAICAGPTCDQADFVAVTGLPYADYGIDHPDTGAIAYSSAIAADGTVVFAYLEDAVPIGPEDDGYVEGDLVVATCRGEECRG